jgi:hypothetical protein
MIHLRDVFHISRSGQAEIRDKWAVEVSCLSGGPDGTRPSRRTGNATGQCIAFKFSKHSILLTDSALKPPNSKQGWNHLKSWSIKADGVKWPELDRGEHCADLDRGWSGSARSGRNVNDIQLSGGVFSQTIKTRAMVMRLLQKEKDECDWDSRAGRAKGTTREKRCKRSGANWGKVRRRLSHQLSNEVKNIISRDRYDARR